MTTLRFYYYINTAQTSTEGVTRLSANDKEFMDIMLFGKVKLSKLCVTHMIVHEETINKILNEDNIEDFLDNQFARFNDHQLNPLGNLDKQKFVKENKLHTSMSVGDVISFNHGVINEFWVCRGIGWEKLN